MKKLLSTLAISGLVGSASTTVVSCDKDTSPDASVALDTVIKTKDLGPIAIAASNGIPTKAELDQGILDANSGSGYDGKHTSIEAEPAITDTNATIKGDGTNYTGSVILSYTKANINSFITVKDLGEIRIVENEKPNENELNYWIKELNNNYNKDYTTIDNITENSANVIGDSENYTGNLTISFNVSVNAARLSEFVTQLDLGTIVVDDISIVPTMTELADAIEAKTENYAFSWADGYTSIYTGSGSTPQTLTEATLIGDGHHYSDGAGFNITVTYTLSLTD